MHQAAKDFCQPLSAAGVETMLAMVELYESVIAEHLSVGQSASGFRRVPKEILQLWRGRIEFCKELRQRLEEHATELKLDAMYEPKANGVAAVVPPAEPPKGRRKKSVFDGT